MMSTNNCGALLEAAVCHPVEIARPSAPRGQARPVAARQHEGFDDHPHQSTLDDFRFQVLTRLAQTWR